MSKVMSLAKLQNHVKRNGFDLSRKNAFTAKVGELLPVLTQEVIPGDKFKINLSSFTRTMPVDTAAYTRIKEYYDFFFVPIRLLWRFFPAFVTQMKNTESATSGDPGKALINFPHMPYLTTTILANWLAECRDDDLKNMFGFNRAWCCQKLFEYLGYSRLLRAAAEGRAEQEQELSHLTTYKLNPFPLLAYQKIYYDFFRYSQWEDIDPACFNVDWNNGGIIPSISPDESDDSMYELRYANYPKDMFMGLLPRAQYGDESLATGFSGFFNLTGQVNVNNEGNNDTVQGYLDNNTVEPFGLSVIALRQAEFLQKWKEISQSGDPDYKTQIKKHFNVTVPDGVSSKCRYLGGSSSNIDINEVVNQNLDADAAQAYIQGKGTGNANATINFEASEHGIIMCIYHAAPLLDYQPNGFDPFNLKVEPTDFAIPEMDSVGMQAVPTSYLLWDEAPQYQAERYLGYAPRYIDYKTAVDTVRGAFLTTLTSWAAPINKEYLYKLMDANSKKFDKLFASNVFKINPAILDSIFAQVVDSTVDTDQLLVNSMFSIDAIRNLDYNGLPY